MSYLAFRYLTGRQTQATLARSRWSTAVQYRRLGCEGTGILGDLHLPFSERKYEREHEQNTCHGARSISHGVRAIPSVRKIHKHDGEVDQTRRQQGGGGVLYADLIA